MGDMADYTLEQIEHEEDTRIDYKMGKMGDFEAYEAGIIDELGYEIKPNIICKYCKKNRLSWQKVSNKWRLFEDKHMHKCPINPLKE